MAILVRTQLEERVKKGDLTFTPALDTFQLRGHAVDLRVGFTFLIARHARTNEEGRVGITGDSLKSSRDNFDVVLLEEGQYFDVLPGEHVLISTLEKVKMPKDLMGVLYPRSSVNRRGLSVDLSGIIDAGYEGNLVIPVRNNSLARPFRVYPGERICQVVFEELAQPIPDMEESRYHKKDIATGALPELDNTEVELIKQGKISELKEKYKVEGQG
ncbi:MAG: dCTP deaminase [Patescibacteria group bacterium]|jgi:dCTP deaminase